jgi:Holliday junction resolvasome RuvABC ATP-dependent DNA helicase subunit
VFIDENHTLEYMNNEILVDALTDENIEGYVDV